MKKRLLIAILVLALIGIPSAGAFAAGEGYLAFDSVKYPEGTEVYQNIISTADGGYAIVVTAEVYSKQGSLRKYNSDGSLAFSYGYTLSNPIYFWGQDCCPVVQTADEGYLLAADGAILVRLDASGKEMWKKQLDGVFDIYFITLAPNGRALLSISENQARTYKILCVDENASVLWQKSKQDLGAINRASIDNDTTIKLATTSDGNFAVLTDDAYNNIIAKLDTNGGIIWNTTMLIINYPAGTRYFNDIAGTSDGGCVLAGTYAGKSQLLKLSADGKQQWNTVNRFAYYQSENLYSVIETEAGYITVGAAESMTLLPKEDVYYYNDTIVACYDKNGNVKYGKAFFEDMEALHKIVKVDGNRYIALASAWNDFTGIAKKDTALMYFNTSATQPKTGWEKAGNDWYYRYCGLRVRGWQNIGGKWYWFNPYSKMATGWVKEAYSESWYYMRADGSMATGWEKANGSWYYFKPNGAMQTGWQKDNGKWYYLSGGSGSVVKGRMQTGWLYAGNSNNWYYLKSDGAMATGWEKVNGSWYYFSPSGAMVTGRQTIDGRKSDFAASGKWLGYV